MGIFVLQSVCATTPNSQSEDGCQGNMLVMDTCDGSRMDLEKVDGSEEYNVGKVKKGSRLNGCSTLGARDTKYVQTLLCSEGDE